MAKQIRARIVGTGSYLPEQVLSNADLEKIVDTTDEWIVTRTGMQERRIAGKEEFTSTMGIEAARCALEDGGVAAEDLELVIVATATPDYAFPSTASLIQHAIGAKKAAAFDIQAACAGFVYALSLVKAYVEAGIYRKILLVASEKLSTITDYNDRTTAVLFGDGAAACLVSNEGGGLYIRDVPLGSDGEQSAHICLPGGGVRCPATQESVSSGKHFLRMNGKEVYKHAVRRMEAASREALERAELGSADLSWVIPHQANLRIIEALAKRLDVPMDKVYLTIHKYGNTSASSVPIALDELLRTKGIQTGENILVMAFGAGLAYAAAVLEQIKA